MCVIRYIHACGHIRESIYGKQDSPHDMCLCGRFATQDCTDAVCESDICAYCPTDVLFPIASTFEEVTMPSADLTLEEQLSVLDAEMHQLQVAQSRIDRDTSTLQAERQRLNVDAELVELRFAPGERESLEGREARRRIAGKVETVETELRIQRLRAELSKMKLDENEAEIRRVREAIDEEFNETLDQRAMREHWTFEEMLNEDSEAYVEANKEVARRAWENMQREMEARKA
ncbi:MAG: hypothetical protein M1822_005222 [Bathelium mastoideum]|nr:MAG: hypothetical protein M1822_005222 [Bathelium mastoideum]